jgi:hypothetical protein
MKHAVKHIHFVGMVAPSREQGSRLRGATGRAGRRMPAPGAGRGDRGQ